MNIETKDLIIQTCLSDTNFQKYAPVILNTLKQTSPQYSKDVISKIKQLIKDKRRYKPSHKLRALRLLNQSLHIGNPSLVAYVQKKIMSRLKAFASHKKQSTDPQRGVDIFGNQQDQQQKLAAINFLNILLNYIYIWATQFPTGPDQRPSEFYKVYTLLNKDSVAFPSSDSIAPKPKTSATAPARRSLQPGGRLTESQQLNPSNSRTNDTMRKSIQFSRESRAAQSAKNTIALVYQLLSTPHYDNQALNEMLATLESFRPTLEMDVQRAMNENNSEKLESLFQIIDEIQQLTNSFSQKIQLVQETPKEKVVKRQQPIIQIPSQFQQNKLPVQKQSGNSNQQYIRKLQTQNSKLKKQLNQRQEQANLKDHQIRLLQAQIQNLRKFILDLKSQSIDQIKYTTQVHNKPQTVSPPNLVDQRSQEQSPPNPGDFRTMPVVNNRKNPFDSPSSSDDQGLAELPVDNDLLCRLVQCFDRGVIFDDQSVQVGVQIQKSRSLKGMMYIGNKSTEKINSIEIQVKDQPGLTVKLEKKISHPIQSGKQEIWNFSVKSKIASFSIPIFEITLGFNEPKTIRLRLPISIFRFVKPSGLKGSQVQEAWENQKETEVDSVFSLNGIQSMQELYQHLNQAGSFSVSTNHDLPTLAESEILSSGVFGNNMILLKVGVLPNLQVSLRVRCQEPHLKEVIMKLFLYQLGGQ